MCRYMHTCTSMQRYCIPFTGEKAGKAEKGREGGSSGKIEGVQLLITSIVSNEPHLCQITNSKLPVILLTDRIMLASIAD